MEKSILNSDSYLNCKKSWGGLNNLKSSTKEQIKNKIVLCKFQDSEDIDMDEFFGGKKIWTLLKGEIHLVMRDVEGKTIVLLKITAENSGFILPKGCLDSLIYSIEAICVGKTELCYIPDRLSMQIYDECASMRKWQYHCYMEMVGKLLELINDLSFLSLKERLKKKLFEYCILYKTDTIPVTHERLAEELASSREVISRLLKKLEEEKVIKIKRKSIQLLDIKSTDSKLNPALMVG